MARNRIIHNVQDVFVGSTPNETDSIVTGIADHSLLKRLSRVQSFNYSIDLPQEDSNTLGKAGVFSRNITAPPTVNLSLSYYLNGVNNERRMGLNVGGVDAIVYTSDFSSNDDGWALGNLTRTVPVVYGGEVEAIRFNGTTTVGYHYAYKNAGLVAGQRYRLTGRYWLGDGSASNFDGLRVYSNSSFDTATPIYSCDNCTVGTWLSFSIDFKAVSSSIYVVMVRGANGLSYAAEAGDTFVIKDFSISKLKCMPHDMVMSGDENNDDARNIYLITNDQDLNAHKNNPYLSKQLTEANFGDPNASSYGVVTFQNCYLTDYSLKIDPRSLPSVDVSYIADSMLAYTSGSGINIPYLDLKKGEVTDNTVNVYTSDFSSDVDGWIEKSYATLSVANDWLVMNVNNTAAGVHYGRRAAGFTTVGKRYKLTGYGLIDEAATNVNSIRFHDGVDYAIGDFVDGTKGTWQSFSAEFTAQTDFMSFYMIGPGGTVFAGDGATDIIYLKDIVVTDITEVKEFIIPKHFKESDDYIGDFTSAYSHANATISSVGVSGVNEFLNDHLTSCSINYNIERETIGYVGDKLFSSRPAQLPMKAQLSFNTLVKEDISGSFIDNVKENEKYNVTIDLKNKSNETLAKYTFSGAKLDGVDYTSSIQSNKTATLKFSNYMDLHSEGVFLEGKITSAINNVYTSDFDNSSDGWTNSITFFDYTSDPDVLQIGASNSYGSHYVYKSSLFTVRKKYRVTGSVYIDGNSPSLDGVRIGDGWDPLNGSAFNTLLEITDLNQWVPFDLEFTAVDDPLVFYAMDGGNLSWTGGSSPNFDLFRIKDIVVTNLTDFDYPQF